jgi:phage-related protein
MDNEPEVIQRQMEQTRSALAEKLGELERQVMDTVQSTTATVSETVENVTEAVSETVENVSEAVSEAVQTVKSTFDIKGHVERHPWPMLGGSVVLGFLGGRL